MTVGRKATWTFFMLGVLLALLGAVALVATSPDAAWADENDSKTVRVGYYENEVFQEGARNDAVKAGYAYEYYRKLAEYTGWEYEYVYDDFSTLYQKLLDGDIDLLAGLAFKEDRAAFIGYPSAPMGNETYTLVKHDTDAETTINPDSLNGKKIGVLNSAIAATLNRYLNGQQIAAEVITFDDYEELFAAFDSGDLDVMAAEGDGAYGRNHAEVLFAFGSSDYYLCTTISRPDLLAELNSAQTQLSIEEPNFVSSLRTKYYSSSISSRAFSVDEREWINTHDTLRVGYLENYLPYSDTDASGHVTGLVKDVVPAIFNNLGISNLNITYSGYKSYDEMIADVRADAIDVAFP